MNRLRAFIRNPAGSAAAEFALVLPIALLFFFGIIDIGRYVWRINELEKAVQMGTRYAVATDIVADRLIEADYVGGDLTCPSPDDPDTPLPITPGMTICRGAQGTVTCRKTGGAVTCDCAVTAQGDDSCQGDEVGNAPAFDRILTRMRVVAPFIADDEVIIKYDSSGLGFAGDPATDDDGNDLSDTAPIVTVAVSSTTMRMLFLLGGQVRLPSFSYSQTLEDGDGAVAY